LKVYLVIIEEVDLDKKKIGEGEMISGPEDHLHKKKEIHLPIAKIKMYKYRKWR
jgi:hypothetical protein